MKFIEKITKYTKVVIVTEKPVVSIAEETCLVRHNKKSGSLTDSIIIFANMTAIPLLIFSLSPRSLVIVF